MLGTGTTLYVGASPADEENPLRSEFSTVAAYDVEGVGQGATQSATFDASALDDDYADFVPGMLVREGPFELALRLPTPALMPALSVNDEPEWYMVEFPLVDDGNTQPSAVIFRGRLNVRGPWTAGTEQLYTAAVRIEVVGQTWWFQEEA
jgi:hypothetical protein